MGYLIFIYFVIGLYFVIFMFGTTYDYLKNGKSFEESLQEVQDNINKNW